MRQEERCMASRLLTSFSEPVPCIKGEVSEKQDAMLKVRKMKLVSC